MRSQPQSFIFCLSMFFLLSFGLLQYTCSDEAKSTFTATEQIDHLNSQVSQARILLQTGKAPTALSQLRTAAADSWKVLFSVGEKRNFLTSTDPIPTTGIISRAARQAAEVHYWWGMAAVQLNSSDEAITAFARAARLCPKNNNAMDLLSNSIQTALTQSLQNGFPTSAAPDVLTNIATFSEHQKGQLKHTLYEIANPVGTSESTFFIYIDGKLSAPSSASKTAPLYRNIPSTELPQELNSSHIMYIYAVPASGYYTDLATLQIKVRYSNPGHLSLATRLGKMALQVKLVNDNFLDRKPAVLTLWLETVHADWPNPITEDSPWEAAAKIDSEPNSIMIFRINQPRSDTEWMRELMHEYGHVAWPDFKSFAPPIEQNANGILSETLTPLWLAENTQDDVQNRNSVYPLIQQTALPALEYWLTEGPRSYLSIGNNELARKYLQGLCVYIDRVYGAKVLSDVMTQLSNQDGNAKVITDALSDILANVGDMSIYLPAAALNAPIDATSLINKSPVNYSTMTDVEFQVYIPAGTMKIDIPWTGNGTISNKSTFGAGLVNQQKLTLNVRGISGWQKLSLQVDGNVTLETAALKQDTD